MEDYYEFLQALPILFEYIFFGYLPIKLFKFFTSKEDEGDNKINFTAAISVGFFIKSIFMMLPTTHSHSVDLALMTAVSILATYMFARFYKHPIFNKLLEKIKIRRTTNKYMWDDLIDYANPTYIEAVDHANDIRYFGQIVLREEMQRQPLIQINKYKMFKGNRLIYDYSNDKTHTVLIDTSVYSDIEIIYKSDN